MLFEKLLFEILDIVGISLIPKIFYIVSTPIIFMCFIYLFHKKKEKLYNINMRFVVVTVTIFIVLSIALHIIGIYDSSLGYEVGKIIKDLLLFESDRRYRYVGLDAIAIAMISACIATHVEHILNEKQKQDKGNQYIPKRKKKKK